MIRHPSFSVFALSCLFAAIGCKGFEGDAGNGGASVASGSGSVSGSGDASGSTSSGGPGSGGAGGGPPAQATVHVVYEDGEAVSGVTVLAFDASGAMSTRGTTASDGTLSLVIPEGGSVAAVAKLVFPDNTPIVMLSYGVGDSVRFVLGPRDPTQTTVGVTVMAPAAAEPAEWYVSCEGKIVASGAVLPGYRGCPISTTFDVLGIHRSGTSIVSAGITKGITRMSPTSAAGLVPIDPANVQTVQVAAQVEARFTRYDEALVGISSGHWIYVDEHSLTGITGNVTAARIEPSNVFDELIAQQQFTDPTTQDARYRFASEIPLPQWVGSALAVPEDPVVDLAGDPRTVALSATGGLGDHFRVRLSEGSLRWVVTVPAVSPTTFTLPLLPDDLSEFELQTGGVIVETNDETTSAHSYASFLAGGVFDQLGRYVRDLEGARHTAEIR